MTPLQERKASLPGFYIGDGSVTISASKGSMLLEIQDDHQSPRPIATLDVQGVPLDEHLEFIRALIRIYNQRVKEANASAAKGLPELSQLNQLAQPGQ